MCHSPVCYSSLLPRMHGVLLKEVSEKSGRGQKAREEKIGRHTHQLAEEPQRIIRSQSTCSSVAISLVPCVLCDGCLSFLHPWHSCSKFLVTLTFINTHLLHTLSHPWCYSFCLLAALSSVDYNRHTAVRAKSVCAW